MGKRLPLEHKHLTCRGNVSTLLAQTPDLLCFFALLIYSFLFDKLEQFEEIGKAVLKPSDMPQPVASVPPPAPKPSAGGDGKAREGENVCYGCLCYSGIWGVGV